MRPVAAIEKGDHWLVVMDYSGSPRHARLSPEQWSIEFASHPSYAPMRSSLPEISGIMAPESIGKWLKDWSAPFTG